MQGVGIAPTSLASGTGFTVPLLLCIEYPCNLGACYVVGSQISVPQAPVKYALDERAENLVTGQGKISQFLYALTPLLGEVFPFWVGNICF